MGRLGRHMQRKALKGQDKQERAYKRVEKQARHDMTVSVVERLAEDHRTRETAVRNSILIFFECLHRMYHFGAKKFSRMIDRMRLTTECIDDKAMPDVTVEALQKVIKAETDLDLSTSKKHMEEIKAGGRDYEIQADVIDELSTKFLLCLRDEYGFAHDRLKRVYDGCGKIGSQLSKGDETIEELEKSLEKAKWRADKKSIHSLIGHSYRRYAI